MKDLIAKIGSFCENHVEKIVMVIVGAVCVWLFFTRVIFSPNVMMLGRTGKAYTPGQIDRQIYEQKAQELRAKLQQQKKGGTGKTYAKKLDGPIDAKDPVIAGVIKRALPNGFMGLFDAPLGSIKATLGTTPAAVATSRQYAERRYRLPLVPDVTDVGINLIRAAAYVPLQEVTLQMTYDKAAVEPNDVDFVTVEGRFDVAEVYRRFQASFAGVDVQKEEWRDPCMAKPIFAAVQLERQELADDGSWTAWQAVPRSRVEASRERFRVYEKISDLPPGGLGVRLMQFKDGNVTSELLQPEAYQIASAEEEWFPPSFYGKFKDLQRKVEADKRRDETEKNRKQTTTATGTQRDNMNRGGQGGMYGGTMQQGGRGAPGSARGRNQPGGMQGGDMYGGQQGGRRGGRAGAMTGPGGYPGPGGQTRQGRRGGPGGDMYGDMYGPGGEMGMRRKSSTAEVYFDFFPEMITFREDLSKRTKPLLIWVFDDTVQPGKIYQYRVRVGVFNPVAGTGQVVERDMDKKDQVILWSPYSEITKPVEVQQRTYLFARDIQDKTNTATVEVARYALGYWRTENFQVKPGETIGKEMEPKKDDEKEKRAKDRARMAAGYGYPGAGGSDRITGMRGGMPPMGPGGMPGYGVPTSPDQKNVPKTINYSTGKVLVDLVQVNDWGNAPNLRPRLYYDMLYTGDGTNLEHMPVSASNWPKDVAAAYQYIQTEKRKEPQPFRAFNKGGLRGRGRGGRGGMEGGYEDMGGMYDEMGGYGDYGGAYGGEGMYPY